MTFKESMQRKIEKNAVKSELDGEEVYLGRTAGVYSLIPFLGKKMKEWHQIYPPVNEDGTWNLPNLIFGGKRNLVKFITLVLIVALAFTTFFTMKFEMQDRVDILCNQYVQWQVQNNTLNSICGHDIVQGSIDSLGILDTGGSGAG